MPMDVGIAQAATQGAVSPTPPIPAMAHGAMVRGLAAGANPGQPFGRFGPMFDLKPCPQVADDVLRDLANVIIKIDAGKPITETEPVDENASIPAGYTYFGQFIDHDLTFDPTSIMVKQVDPGALVDFRSPAFDLDNLYGRGPSDQPYMYEGKDKRRLRVGTPMNTGAAPIAAKVGTKNDLFRLPDNTPILGDKRNDENKIVSQLHAAMTAFHNKVVESDAILTEFDGDISSPEARFMSAVTIVRWHYQWVVLHDFLERICEPGMVTEVLNPGGTPRLQNFLKKEATYPYMPLEFAGAAYRLGHSMVRPSYALNSVVMTHTGGDPSKERIPTFTRAADPHENLNGFPGTLPSSWGIDWSFFLPDVAPRSGGTTVAVDGAQKPVMIPQPSYRMDAQIAAPLSDLPEFFDQSGPGGTPSIVGNLAFRNLKRGQLLRLPSGQAIATALGIVPLSDDIVWGTGSRVGPPDKTSDDFKLDFTTTDNKRKAFKAKWVDPAGSALKGNAPLWYYILREAEYYGVRDLNADGASFGGEHLGPVGSRIVAETFIGLLYLDKASFLHDARGFKPMASIAKGAKDFRLGHLISFALT